MKIYTYFDPVPGINIEDTTKLLLLWKDAWEEKGFTPVVLNERVALKAPGAQIFREAMDKLPTINPKPYEMACYMRWMAMMAVGGGIMSDYDVFPYADFDFTNDRKQLTSLQTHVPSLVYGTPTGYQKVVERMLTYEVEVPRDLNADLKPHVSDMLILLNAGAFYVSKHEVRNYGEPGWTKSPFVHYSNGSMKDHQPRWKYIKELRK